MDNESLFWPWWFCITSNNNKSLTMREKQQQVSHWCCWSWVSGQTKALFFWTVTCSTTKDPVFVQRVLWRGAPEPFNRFTQELPQPTKLNICSPNDERVFIRTSNVSNKNKSKFRMKEKQWTKTQWLWIGSTFRSDGFKSWDFPRLYLHSPNVIIIYGKGIHLSIVSMRNSKCKKKTKSHF